jgi:hypothetical protein
MVMNRKWWRLNGFVYLCTLKGISVGYHKAPWQFKGVCGLQWGVMGYPAGFVYFKGSTYEMCDGFAFIFPAYNNALQIFSTVILHPIATTYSNTET